MEWYTYTMEIDSAALRVVLWILSASALLFSLVIGSIFAYHWFTYSMNVIASTIATIAYVVVCVVLLTLLLALTLSV